MKYLTVVGLIYLGLGFACMALLQETPYRENPKWTMVLLWPLWLVGLLTQR